MNILWFSLVWKTCVYDNPFLFNIVRRTEIIFSLIRIDNFWFAHFRRIDTIITIILHTHLIIIYLWPDSHFSSYGDNIQIDYHHTLSMLYFWIKVTVSSYMFGPITHITLISQLLKLLNNLRNILQTDISNGIPCLFPCLWPSKELDNRRVNQTLYSSSQNKCFVPKMWVSSCP